jgi:hypothetical protein
MNAALNRRILVLSSLGVIALGALALSGFWHPNAPAEEMHAWLPRITLPTVLLAGVVDGINPCAFTVLLLFITAMMATMQVGTQANTHDIRMRMVGWD